MTYTNTKWWPNRSSQATERTPKALGVADFVSRFQSTPVRAILFGLRPVTLFLLFAAPVIGADERSQVPTRFTAGIGGFLGASYSVELRDGALLYTSYTALEGGRREQKQETLTPTAAQWRDFRRTLDALKVWQWRTNYPNHGVSDGTQWTLDIAYADRSLTTRGDNNYPDGTRKPSGSDNSTKTFKRYLAAIRKLLGGKNFE